MDPGSLLRYPSAQATEAQVKLRGTRKPGMTNILASSKEVGPLWVELESNLCVGEDSNPP
jgi:hypothetical protein